MSYSQEARISVGELIGELQKFDPEMLVLVNGYEGGYQPPEVYALDAVVLDYKGNYEGFWHEPTPKGSYDWKPSDDGLPRLPAVIVSRGREER